MSLRLRFPHMPLAVVFVLVAVALALAGCGRRETAADRAVHEGVLLRSLGSQQPVLDPHLATTLADAAVLKALFEGLVDHDPQTLAPQPAAAERWDVSADGLTCTFHLRNDIRWSNGEPVTAEDFAGSFRRALTPALGAPNATLMHVLRGARAFHRGETNDFSSVGVQALDARTLRLTLETPTPHFLAVLTHFVWLPVHLPGVRAAGGEADRANRWTRVDPFVGNGPFRLAEYRPGQFVRVEANPHHREASRLRLRGVVFSTYDIAGEERAFRGGEIHVTDALPPGKLPGWRERRPEALRIAPSYGLYFYRINVTRPPLDDARVRRAFALAVDRVALTRDVLNGAYVPAHSLTPPGPAGYTPPIGLLDDAAAARALLEEAGFAGGAGMRRLEVLFNTSDYHRPIAEALQQMWRRQLGIEVQLVNQEYSVFADSRRLLHYDFARSPWFGDYLDPLSFLEIFTTGNANNQTGWSNADYDRLVAAATREPDAAKRLQLFADAETILLREVPIIPLYVYSTVRLIDPRVRGWFDNPLDQHPCAAMWLEP